MPDLGEVPDLDVPSYLPDLPGIADDLSYSADLGPGFAPSGFLQSIPELPSFVSSSASCLQICGFFFFVVFFERHHALPLRQMAIIPLILLCHKDHVKMTI